MCGTPMQVGRGSTSTLVVVIVTPNFWVRPYLLLISQVEVVYCVFYAIGVSTRVFGTYERHTAEVLHASRRSTSTAVLFSHVFSRRSRCVVAVGVDETLPAPSNP